MLFRSRTGRFGDSWYSEAFIAYVEQFLAPALEPGDIVIMDNLPAHKVTGVAQAIEAAGAELLYLPLNADSEERNKTSHNFNYEILTISMVLKWAVKKGWLGAVPEVERIPGAV